VCFNGGMKDVGMLLVVVGAVILVIGLVLVIAGRVPWLGHLPGDISVRGKSWSFSFPLVTCILVSIVLTVLLNIVLRLFRR